jgi:hypothetical protein
MCGGRLVGWDGRARITPRWDWRIVCAPWLGKELRLRSDPLESAPPAELPAPAAYHASSRNTESAEPATTLGYPYEPATQRHRCRSFGYPAAGLNGRVGEPASIQRPNAAEPIEPCHSAIGPTRAARADVRIAEVTALQAGRYGLAIPVAKANGTYWSSTAATVSRCKSVNYGLAPPLRAVAPYTAGQLVR